MHDTTSSAYICVKYQDSIETHSIVCSQPLDHHQRRQKLFLLE